MSGRIRKFTQLDRATRKLFIQSWILLGYKKIALMTGSFKRLVAHLDHQGAESSVTESTADDLEVAASVGSVVRMAARHTPWESTCLVQALVAQHLLEKRGISGMLYLGAAISRANQQNKLDAHAWLTCGPVFVTGEAGHEQFAVVSRYRW